MDTALLTLPAILIPLGFYLIIERPELTYAGPACVMFGLVFWVIAYFRAIRKEKREQEERMEQREELRELLVNIHKELQRLNQDKE